MLPEYLTPSYAIALNIHLSSPKICTIIAALVMGISAAPGYDHQPLALPQGHFSFPSAPLQIPVSHEPLTLHKAAFELPHTPIHAAPLELPHASLQLSHAPVVHAAPLEIHQAPIVHAAPVAIAHEPEHHAPANYEFKYGVHDAHTHDIKEQAERRHGDRVEGHYSLVEPDGTTRTVKYTADHQNGFNAVVTKSGHATHPVTAHAQHAIPVVKKIISAPVLQYSHAPLQTTGHATSYSSYGNDYASNYAQDYSYGGHY
ncbi:hypothetical protein C0J52_10435 [Blattella germanica]|nr:hypothetical protein C0J52_10435 [Blattella germanica]